MNRILLPLILIGLLGWDKNPSVPDAAPVNPADGPVNFIFILADDLGWSDIACYGSTFYETPNIDRLASQGMRFTDAYAACPVCSPTRASILTGKYPARLNLTDWIPGRQYTRGPEPANRLISPDFHQQLPLSETTLAEALQTKGYVSASIGKWHLGGEKFMPADQGFAVSIGGAQHGSPPTYFYPFKNDHFGLPGLADTGKEGDYLTDRLTTEGIRFIAENRNKPFLLYLPYYTVHIPLQPKPELLAQYTRKAADNPGATQSNPHYAAMVHSLDENVGRLMQALDEYNLARNTVIIFMSDNGGLSVKEGPHTPATSNAPLRAGKGHLYEGGIREPLIIRWPEVIKPGSICNIPVSSVDFYPLMLEAAGIPVSNRSGIDGESILPLLRQQGKMKREAIFWHYPHYSNQGGKPGAAVRMGDFKLIEFYEDNRLELYNVREDISESRNLAREMPRKTREMHEMLKRWRKDVNARMPIPNPGYAGS